MNGSRRTTEGASADRPRPRALAVTTSRGRRILRVLSLGLAASLPVAATAQDAPPRRVTVTADVGFVSTSGNTSVTSLNVGDKVTILMGAGVLTQSAAVFYGRTSGVETTNNQLLRLRYDYPLSARLAVYGFGGYERNKYGGIARRFDENAGLAYRVLQAARDSLNLEAGAGMVQESRYVEQGSSRTTSNGFPSARSALTWKHLFGATSYFQQVVEYLPNLESSSEYRVNSESALVAPISTHIGLKAAAVVRYNNEPPQPELEKTDRLMSVGLQLTF